MTIRTSSPGAPDTPSDAAERIKAEAKRLGFDLCCLTGPTLDPSVSIRLQTAVDAGYHGHMAWLAGRRGHRESPRGLWPGTRSVIMLGMNYGPETDPMSTLPLRTKATISVYARGDDYHDVLKKRLKALGRWMGDALNARLKVFVDTAPVAEKPLAAAAGLGWQGKHTNLVSRDFGSWLFLGAIFTDLELPVDAPETDHCGSCRACLDICPTNAFPAPYRLDARACISYLTIEHDGPIPLQYRAAMGNRIYGCDDCLAVCPWNKFAEAGRETKLAARENLNAPPLAALSELDDASFRALFRKSPIKRIGRNRFVRNVMIAIGNSGTPSLLKQLAPRLTDDSPMVRAMAVWAWARLGGAAGLIEERRAMEKNDDVLTECSRVLANLQNPID